MKSTPTKVTKSRFELELDGHTAFLEFDTDDHGWMTLWHTEVPKELGGSGIGSKLVTTALQYAQEHQLKVDVICPFAKSYIARHPEYKSLVSSR